MSWNSELESSENSCAVVICTFNERENLPPLIAAIQTHLPHVTIVVVDDNSPDGTGAWAEEEAKSNLALRVIIRRQERGLGGAVRTGIQWTIAQHFQWMLNLDADFSHDPADLPQLLSVARAGMLDCVVGTRYAAGGKIEGWPVHRRWMSRSVNRFATLILGLPVSDCSGSLRCYRVDSLRAIEPDSLRSQGYAIFEELLVRLKRQGARFGEVPIVFRERRSGLSKLTFAEAGKAALQLIRISLQR